MVPTPGEFNLWEGVKKKSVGRPLSPKNKLLTKCNHDNPNYLRGPPTVAVKTVFLQNENCP